MKYILTIAFAIAINTLHCNAQTVNEILSSYFDLYPSNVTTVHTRLHHKPVKGDFGVLKDVTLFFPQNWKDEDDILETYAVIYHAKIDSTNNNFGFLKFSPNSYLPNFGKGVISVFFENLDKDAGNELIILYESSGRCHFSDGGYAGIHPRYETKVFKCVNMDDDFYKITEYEVIGKLLTINNPFPIGTKKEEEIIGREDNYSKFQKVIGVTYNASQVRKIIKKFKENGFFGD